MNSLLLTNVPDALVAGIYKVAGKPGKMPPRTRRLHPAAFSGWLTINQTPGLLVVSDMFRSPESSLAACQGGRGALKPGYSGHGFGFSVDVDIDQTLKNMRATIKSKLEFDAWMTSKNWHCHRLDGKRGSEDWHYDFNVDGQLVPAKGETSMYAARERMIMRIYGDAFKLDSPGAQSCLKSLGFYHGEIDGALGPISKQAVSAFQRAWLLEATGALDTATRRTLFFVAACKQLPDVV